MTYSFACTEYKPQVGDCINKHAKVNVYFSLGILCLLQFWNLPWYHANAIQSVLEYTFKSKWTKKPQFHRGFQMLQGEW